VPRKKASKAGPGCGCALIGLLFVAVLGGCPRTSTTPNVTTTAPAVTVRTTATPDAQKAERLRLAEERCTKKLEVQLRRQRLYQERLEREVRKREQRQRELEQRLSDLPTSPDLPPPTGGTTPPPASFAAPTYQPPAEVAPVGGEVYITRTGAKYHVAGCQYLRRSQIPISRENAQAQGYSPCSVCGG
jgi:hypothetical protein